MSDHREKRTVEGVLLKLVFYPISWLFGFCVWVRNWCYDRGILRSRRLTQPVISVGNLSMGGAGKTPLCDWLVRTLSHRGFRVAVLSRGYGRQKPKRVLRVDPEGNWQDFGDEPMMLARRNPNACFCVGGDRHAAAEMAKDFDPNIFVLDDGFQHRSLKRDLDLVVIDVTQPLPRLFPVGMFRENWRALKRAHAVVLSRCEENIDLQPFVSHVRRISPSLPVLTFQTVATRVVFSGKGISLPVSELADKTVGAFAGIAYPEKFFGLLRGLGAHLILERSLEDHQTLDSDELAKFMEECKKRGAIWVLTTEKDFVKLEVLRDSGILLGFLPLEIIWGDQEQFNRLLKGFLR